MRERSSWFGAASWEIQSSDVNGYHRLYILNTAVATSPHRHLTGMTLKLPSRSMASIALISTASRSSARVSHRLRCNELSPAMQTPISKLSLDVKPNPPPAQPFLLKASRALDDHGTRAFYKDATVHDRYLS
jgi:hypothetical protein